MKKITFWIIYYTLWGFAMILIGSIKLVVQIYLWVSNKKLIFTMKLAYYKCLIKIKYFKIRNKLLSIFK